MPDPLATQGNVETKLLRPLTTLEAQYIDGLIEEASALLRMAAPSVDALIARFNTDPAAQGGISPIAAASVVAGAVKDYLSNPNGIVNTSDTAGPYSTSTSFALRGDKGERGVLQITPTALATLFPNRKRARVGSFRLTPSLAPRPVGRYGPVPTLPEAIDAVATFGGNPQQVEARVRTEAPL